MFDVGFFELLIILIIFLLGIQPSRFPEIAKNFIRFRSSFKSSFNDLKNNFEKTISLDEIKQDIYNEDTIKTLEEIDSNIEEKLKDNGK